MFSEFFEKIAISPVGYAKAALSAMKGPKSATVGNRISGAMGRSATKGQVRQNLVRSQAMKPKTLAVAKTQMAPTKTISSGQKYRQNMQKQWSMQQQKVTAQKNKMVGNLSSKAPSAPFLRPGPPPLGTKHTQFINMSDLAKHN